MLEVLDLDTKKKILDNYNEKKKELILKHYAGESGLEIVRQLSDLTDQTIQDFAKISFPDLENVAIIVLGGYGRRELCFKSDIDISIVYTHEDISKLKVGIENFYYCLLDLKVDIGFSPRNIRTFLDLSKEDLTVATALLQGRFLYGNEEIFKTLTDKFKKLIKSRRKAYIEATLKSRKIRYQNTGSSIYMMEPHVKEGEGGLRDFHEVYWIAKVLDDVNDYKYFVEKQIILEEEYIELMNAYDYLLKIRNQMHLLCNKKCDVLTFPLQEEVAKKLGYASSDADYEELRESVERMMKLYYLNAKSINNITNRILKNLVEQENPYEEYIPIDNIFIRTSKEIDILDPKKFEKDPINILKAFKYYKNYGLNFSSNLEYLLRKNERILKNKVLTEEEKAIIREIFSNISNLPRTLKKMQDFYVLDDIIPEFGYQRCHFQYDHYHKYTTDAHAIKALEEMENLQRIDSPHKKQIYDIYKEIERKDLLIWAVFLHDIGKGHKTDHSELGAELSKNILERFGYPPADVETVSFLVRHHLDMAHISQRRNLHEPKVITEFVKLIKNKELLNMLTVLTYCDANAVGPGAWNDWKFALLMELYTKSTQLLTEGSIESIEKKAEEKRIKLLEILIIELGKEKAVKHLNRLSDYYIISTPIEDILKHVKLEDKLLSSDNKFSIHFEKNTGAGYSQVIIAIKDIDNPLLIITGILSYLGINILTAYSFERKDGVYLVDLQISTSSLEAVDEAKFSRFVEILENVLKDSSYFEKISVKRQKGFKASTVPPPIFVKVDNEMSEGYTIFDVSAEDRIGLLFDIIKVFASFDLYVHMVKASTQGLRARDAFYVRTKDKEKITDSNFLKNVQEKLLEVIKS
ncbi:[protein-PII] uridylyltransferase [Sulfurihydrogenibium azorense]|uniref:[protein-PII] uridylyltransferase n=1 Tax=Sulfurihydrogenibium azorense TaxID=309806 RepID=UPI002409C393|nr:[protein-PII] uridylyltransferase [Sulfurihydrogenibium azorense]MDM7273810.1 [protein-PII] uridylyltransferase [Sulfurihydrogenibium azorense]